MKLNFWENFALNTAISALETLISQSGKLSDKQKTDLNTAVEAVRTVESDFTS